MSKRFQSVSDPATNQNFQIVEGLLPLGPQDLSDGAKELFLQLAVAENLSLSVGLGTYEFSASSKSKVLTINHGLGAVPAGIQLTMFRSEAGEGVFQPQIIEGSVNETSFKTKAVHTASATINLDFYWAALG